MNENSVRNLIAGLFVIFMLFVMIFIGFFLSGGFKTQASSTFVTNFNSISGLNVGSDVSYKGFSIGKVSDISINKKNPKLVSVYMQIHDDIPIYNQTIASLQTIGITGQSKVELSLDITKNEVGLDLMTKEKGKILEIKSKPSQLESILKKVGGIATSLEEISQKFNKMMSEDVKKIILWDCLDGIIYGDLEKLSCTSRIGGRKAREGSANDIEEMKYFFRQDNLLEFKY